MTSIWHRWFRIQPHDVDCAMILLHSGYEKFTNYAPKAIVRTFRMSDPKPITMRQMKILKFLMKPFSRFNAMRYLKSGGKSMGSFGGRDICVVTMKGAKSGKTRHMPLMYVPYKEGVILVASFAGAPKHPTWYYNIAANPDIDVQVKDQKLTLRARIASAEEKAEVWPICVDHYPDFELYLKRTDRDIPVFICEPRL